MTPEHNADIGTIWSILETSVMRSNVKLIVCTLFMLVVLVLVDLLLVLCIYPNTRKRSPRCTDSVCHNLPGQRLRERYDTDLDLRVIVLTYNREKSLNRLLVSLNEAEYYGDRVHIDIWLDRSKKGGTIDAETYQTAATFSFKFGSLTVHNHTKHVGIYGQWIDTWKADNKTKEVAVILEDDLTVSKYFYKWLKLVHKKYDHLPYINGYSLQGRSMKHAGKAGNLHGPESEVVFVYPVLGTWGFSPNRNNWIAFVTWYHKASRDPAFKPLVSGLLPSKWYARLIEVGKTDRIWSMWHIYYAQKHNELTVYANLPKKQGLTINWIEPGLNFKKKLKKVNKFPMLETWDPTFEALPEVPVELNTSGDVVKLSFSKNM